MHSLVCTLVVCKQQFRFSWGLYHKGATSTILLMVAKLILFHSYDKSKMNVYPYHIYIWAATWDFQQCGMCDQQRLRPACANVQSDQSLCLSLEYSMNIKLLTEQHLEFLSLKGGYTGSSESTLVKMPHCWKSHVAAHLYMITYTLQSLYKCLIKLIRT